MVFVLHRDASTRFDHVILALIQYGKLGEIIEAKFFPASTMPSPSVLEALHIDDKVKLS